MLLLVQPLVMLMLQQISEESGVLSASAYLVARYCTSLRQSALLTLQLYVRGRGTPVFPNFQSQSPGLSVMQLTTQPLINPPECSRRKLVYGPGSPQPAKRRTSLPPLSSLRPLPRRGGSRYAQLTLFTVQETRLSHFITPLFGTRSFSADQRFPQHSSPRL